MVLMSAHKKWNGKAKVKNGEEKKEKEGVSLFSHRSDIIK